MPHSPYVLCTVDVDIAMEDAIVVHLESAHQVRVAPDVHGGLSERQNVVPIHRRNDVFL